MTTQQIADKLVAYCRKGDWENAQKELYADNAVSVEPEASPAFEKETNGLPAILAKGKKFDDMVDTMHSIKVSDPIVAGNSFACVLDMDATMKGRGRMPMKELCVYTVQDGKVIREEFIM
ncbi:SnoaL-like domain-containing protein [Paraflavitalea pollutisoli]|uniref:SnoaL-like domain-containing protein n=1 Tax=Paraflavitalea pollutisoli TaxID=3034143 RepID=UPI0023EC3526|nr:SnoaL-like domain-containing protein [Paraflavitalea sp. H1-2-19X]